MPMGSGGDVGKAPGFRVPRFDLAHLAVKAAPDELALRASFDSRARAEPAVTEVVKHVGRLAHDWPYPSRVVGGGGGEHLPGRAALPRGHWRPDAGRRLASRATARARLTGHAGTPAVRGRCYGAVLGVARFAPGRRRVVPAA